MLEFWDGIEQCGFVYEKISENKSAPLAKLITHKSVSAADREFISAGPRTSLII
jgi:hypothetical protein